MNMVQRFKVRNDQLEARINSLLEGEDAEGICLVTHGDSAPAPADSAVDQTKTDG